MTSIEIVKDLVKTYHNKSLNEADTRFKIIDTILIEILNWKKEPLMLEVMKNGNRSDYVLYGNNNNPVLIIESKKTGKYFELPKNINSGSNYQKILVEKLLSDKNVSDAIYQVKDYCEELGCNYAAISNGHVWIFFCIHNSTTPWKKLPAFVIKNLNFFSDDYILAINNFSFNSIINNNSLKQCIGLSRQLTTEIFYPKSAIAEYNLTINSNNYAVFFNTIVRKFFGNIPFDDDIFFEKCYVTNKGHYDDLQKNMHGIIYDSITPFFRNLGFTNLFENKTGGDFVKRIETLLQVENLNNVMILFGGRGSGKSTFLKRLIKHLKPDIINRSVVCLVDLIASSQTSEGLSKEIWEKVLKSIDKENLLEKDKENLLNLFDEKFKLFRRQILSGYIINSEEYNRLLNDFLIKTLEDTKYCCEILSQYWKKSNKGLIIILDNMDQLSTELQDTCYLTAYEISKKLNGLVIISMREERFYAAKEKGVLDAYLNPGFHITSPVIPEVISKRIEYAINNIANNLSLKKEIGIEDGNLKSTITNFLLICNKEIKRKDSFLSQFLRYSTHGDVRQALDFFNGFILSGYTNVSEMSNDLGWKFQSHQVIKPMMIPNRYFYEEASSRMPNFFQLRNELNSSHFTGLRILTYLNNRAFDKTTSGLIDVNLLIKYFDNQYDLKEDCIKNLSIFLNKGIVEANNRVEEFSKNVDQVKITSFGKYLLEFLAFDFTYLDLISLDCGIFDESLNNLLIRSTNKELEYYREKDFLNRIKLRLNRVDLFIEYLEKQEEAEILSLALGETEYRFTKKMRLQFDSQKQIVMKSANNREFYDNLKNNLLF